jgi:phage shock protein A
VGSNRRKEGKMSILFRIKRILAANFNSLLEKAEDPESLLEELIREMDANLITLREEVTHSIATEKRLARQVMAIEKKISLRQADSEQAVRDGDDGLARQALTRKLAQERNLAEYAAQHDRARESVESLKTQLHLLEDKVRDAHRRQEVLAARRRRDQAREAIVTATRDFAVAARRSDALLSEAGLTTPGAHAFLQDQVLDLEAEADTIAALTDREPDLEEVFKKAELDEEIERQLRELKSKLHPTS